MYLRGIETKFDRDERNYDGGEKLVQEDDESPFRQKACPFGSSELHFIDSVELRKMHWYILDNCDAVHKFYE